MKARHRATAALKLGPAEDMILENGNDVTQSLCNHSDVGGPVRRSLLLAFKNLGEEIASHCRATPDGTRTRLPGIPE